MQKMKPDQRRQRNVPLSPPTACRPSIRMLCCGTDKPEEQGVRSVGPALEFGMVLDPYKEVLIREFYCLYESVVR